MSSAPRADLVGSIDSVSPAFECNCPLWTYVLAETVESEAAVKTTKRWRARTASSGCAS